MTDSIHRLQRDRYCFNPQCEHPENSGDRDICHSCNSPLLLQDRYQIIAPIGQGGFGRTFKAIDTLEASQPYRAIKQFFPQQQGSKDRDKAAELFRQEGERLKKLGDNPQIPQLFHYFEAGDRSYLVQEYIDGRNLEQLLATEQFNEQKIKNLLLDLLPVLATIHDSQVIHRDIKPENIIRRESDGKLFLVDLGAAKYTTETTLGKTGTVIGSAAYTAPEQVRGKAVFASDIYSLGVTCVHLLTRIPPFDLFDSAEDKWIWREYLAANNKVSKSLGKVLDKMLQSGTKHRYHNAKAVIKDLNRGSVPLVFYQTKLLIAIAALLLGWVGLFNLLKPVRQQVSNPNPSVITPNPRNNTPLTQPSTGTNNGLFATIDGQQQALALEHTDVQAEVSGNVSRVEVTQTFANPYDKPLEAVYKFPLPDDAAVDDMEIIIGDRIIRGSIKKKQEAKQIYEQAKQQGKTAGLLAQERDNVFTQSLANILPGEKIEVKIRYSNSLKFEAGEYEFVFPMVVGPRYNGSQKVGNQPPIIQTAGISWGNQTAVANPPILPKNRSGQDINVAVEINAGVPISLIESLTHRINVQKSNSATKVQLAKGDTIPNKDLILRYQVAGAETQTTVLTQNNQQGGHFATYLIPAVEYNPKEIVPKDVVFLIDTSGSQSGSPIEQSRELMRQFIAGLNPEDTFTIVDFSDAATKLSDKPLANTAANRDKALAYVNNIQANGGTQLMNGIDTVLKLPSAPAGRLRSIVLLTDGLIGDDKYIIGEVQKRLQPGNRLYTFGVGSSTNHFLINRLAEVGRGTSELLSYNEPATEIAQEFFQEINNPVVTNIETSWIGKGEAPEIYPHAAPDLFANQPLVLYGRKSDGINGKLYITGTVAGGKRYEQTLNVNFNQVTGNDAIAQLWGRAKIKDLMTQMHWGKTPAGEEAVTNTALAYNLLSDYTSFVAVTEEVRVDPQAASLKEDIEVELPKGMIRGEAKLKSAKQSPVAFAPQPAPQTSSNNNSADVPEPGQIFGNLLALILLILFFRWRKLQKNQNPPINE